MKLDINNFEQWPLVVKIPAVLIAVSAMGLVFWLSMGAPLWSAQEIAETVGMVIKQAVGE